MLLLSWLFPVPNDLVLLVSLLGLLACYLSERSRQQQFKARLSSRLNKMTTSTGIGSNKPGNSICISTNACSKKSLASRLSSQPVHPVYEGRPNLVGSSILCIGSARKFTPINLFRAEVGNTGALKQKKKPAINRNGMFGEVISETKTIQGAIGLSKMKGCEEDSQAFLEMKKFFPDLPDPDLMRFLIARKGNVEAAKDLLDKSLAWRREKMPLKRSKELSAAISAKCFYPHGVDKDGAPIVCFVGAMYDSKKASSEYYVMLAAHVIDWVLARSLHVNVTVVVHVDSIPGAPNEPTNIEFVKGFVKALSDNFPERLKRLMLYPFPWFANAIWSGIKMFIDPRTSDKVQLISGDGRPIPAKVETFIDPKQLPAMLGGQDDRPVIDLELTLE